MMKLLTYFKMVYYIYLLMTFTVSKSRETGNIWYTRRRQEKQIHNTIYGDDEMLVHHVQLQAHQM
jgi:hypothetical protein